MSAAFKRPISVQTTASLPGDLTPSEETETMGPNICPAAQIYKSIDEDTKVLGIKLMFEGNPLSIYDLYSPPPKMLRLHAIQPEGERWIIMGDFNSHSPSWGYLDLHLKGDEVEDRIITNQTVPINRPD